MVTLILGLSLLVAFLSTVMTIGNALNKTDMAKFWALLSTVAMFITTFIFIVDTYDLLGIKKAAAGEDAIPVAEQPAPQLNKEHQPGSGYDVQSLQYLQEQAGTYVYDSEVARILLLDLLAKRFTGDLSGLTASQKQWLIQHKHLYPADTEQALTEIKRVAMESVTQEQLRENVDDYKQTVIKGQGVVLEVVAPTNDAVVQDMQIQILTEDKSVYVLYYPAVTELKVGDSVQFYGTPVAKSNMNSATFGTVSTILFYTNFIMK